MALELYRRHNALKCKTTSPTDSSCTNTRKPCPIWVRGTQADGTYVRQPLKLRDWKEAQKVLRAWDEQGVKPPSAKTPTTIEQLQKQLLDNLHTVNRAPATIKKYEVLFRQLKAFALDKGLRFVPELDVTMLEQFRATWKDGALSKSKKQERLRGVLRYAVRHRMVETNSAIELDRVKVVSAQVVPFTDDELKRIWVAAKADTNSRLYALALLMRFSGLRISDAVGLRIDQIKDGHLSLRTQKAHTDVSVPLPAPVLTALDSFKPASAAYYFWNGEANLTAVAGYYRDYYFRRAFIAAKIDGKPHPHQFRHTFASKLLLAGVSLVELAALLGNSVRVVEKHYSKWVRARQQRLDAAVRKANGYHALPKPTSRRKAVKSQP
jgi:integrase